MSSRNPCGDTGRGGTAGSERRLGDIYGRHRVVAPAGALPQQAERLEASLPIYPNEMLISVDALNIDSASFHQIKTAAGGDKSVMREIIAGIVAEKGKHQNPVTGSGGMLIGTVREIGVSFFREGSSQPPVSPGDRIATLVSLTLTPLQLDSIREIHLDIDRVDVTGHAILFQSGIYSVLPSDIPDNLSLAVLDVCGAPAQTFNICRPGFTTAVLGAGGKSGMLCCQAAKKAAGQSGKVIGLDYSAASLARLRELGCVDEAIRCDARDAVACMEALREATGGKMADLVVNVANLPDTEMASILCAAPGGTVYFFNMATSFTKATLGAEGAGAHVNLLMGNGYTPGHADFALDLLRESAGLRRIYTELYA